MQKIFRWSSFGGLIALAAGSLTIATAPASAQQPAGSDARCTDAYNRIMDRFGKGLTDAQIDWAFEYERAKREGLPCPPNFPGPAAVAQQAPPPQRPYYEQWEENCFGGGRRVNYRQGDTVYIGPCKAKED